MEFTRATNRLLTDCHDELRNKHSDDSLIRMVRSGDRRAFDALMERHGEKLFARILRITRHIEDAEDSLQDTFLAAYLKLDQFEGRSQFSTWLTTIATNQALVCLRRRRSKALLNEEVKQSDEGVFLPEAREPRPDAEKQLLSHEALTHFHDAITRLRPKDREIICLLHIEEHSVREVAAELGLTVAAVKARIHRARRDLRECIHSRRYRGEIRRRPLFAD